MSSIVLASDMALREIKEQNRALSDTNNFKLKVKLLNKNANLPQRSTAGAAGYDIYAAEECSIRPGDKAIISTGISIELPECPFPNHIYCMKIMSRSGLSAKHSIEKGAGLIDADYKGEIKIILYNHTPKKERELTNDGEVGFELVDHRHSLHINIGDRIAQGVIIPVAVPEVEEVIELTESVRGTDGFGSTGV